MSKRIILKDDRYIAKLPFKVAIDMATYFVHRGIPAEFVTYGSGDERTVEFKKDASRVETILGWITRWEEGHEYCPFCGGVPEVYCTEETHTDDNGTPVTTKLSHIRCTECGCMTNGVAYWMEDDRAWKQWDRRVRY